MTQKVSDDADSAVYRFFHYTIVRVPYLNVLDSERYLDLSQEVIDWLDDNTQSWSSGAYCGLRWQEIWFENEEDAMMFRMVWG